MTISVIIPVYREEAAISDVIHSLRANACAQRIMEIIVVDGSPGGETISALPERDAGVKGILSSKGRGIQMNAGAAIASGDVLLFLHADTELPEGGLTEVVRSMKNEQFVGGAFSLALGGKGLWFRIIERVASLRSRLTRIPYGDQAIFIRRDHFSAMGGYREWPIMEDVDLMRRLKREGAKINLLKSQARSSTRRWEKEGVAACTLRNWAIMGLYLLGVSPKKLARWYP